MANQALLSLPYCLGGSRHPSSRRLTYAVASDRQESGHSVKPKLIRSDGNHDTELRLTALMRAHGIIHLRQAYGATSGLAEGSGDWRTEGGSQGRQTARFAVRPDFVFPRLKLAVFVDGPASHEASQGRLLPPEADKSGTDARGTRPSPRTTPASGGKSFRPTGPATGSSPARFGRRAGACFESGSMH